MLVLLCLSDVSAAQAGEAVPGAFGSTAISTASVRMSGRWAELLAEQSGEIFSTPCAGGALCATPLMKRWPAVLARRNSGALAPVDALQIVNSLANGTIRFQADEIAHGVSDEWASPADTLRSGRGDCEDYALLKMAMLVGLGIDPAAMRLVVGQISFQRVGHAVLVVRIDGRNWVLDNLSERVRQDIDIADFQPFYSLGYEGAWLHGAPATSIVAVAR